MQEALPHAAENDVYLQVELLKELLSCVDRAGSQGTLADRDTSPAHSTSSLESDGGSMPEEPPGRQVKNVTQRNIYILHSVLDLDPDSIRSVDPDPAPEG
jgi:hypothetical protein